MNELFLSPTGHSGEPVLKSCMKKRLYYREGWRKRRKEFYFAFGSIIHKHAFRPYLDETVNEELVPAEGAAEVKEIIETGKAIDEDREGNQYEQEIDVTPKDQGSDNIAQIQLEVWSEKKYRKESVVACERKLWHPLVDPRTGNQAPEMEGVNVTGRLDLIVEREVRALRDLKTAKSVMGNQVFADFGYTLQLGIYRYLWAAVEHENIKDVGCFWLTKHLTKETITKYATDSPRDALAFRYVYNIIYATAQSVRAAEQSGVWPQNFSACQERYGKMCEFAPLCFPGQYKNPNQIIEKKLIKRRRT